MPRLRRSGGRTYHIPNYATSYANERSNLISVTFDEDKKTSKGIIAIVIIFLLFAVVPLSWAMRKPTFQELDSFQNTRGTGHKDRRINSEVRTEENSERVHVAAESVFKNEESPEPHLDLKASLPDWDAIKSGGHCSAFGTREYTAKLRNLTWSQNIKWKTVCENTWATIHGVKVMPTKCERKWPLGDIIGYWSVNFAEPECLADWGSFADKGCMQNGSKLRRFQSRLWNIKAGEDWMTICTTAPATIHGIVLSKPTKCEDKGLWGVYGVWEFEDQGCR